MGFLRGFKNAGITIGAWSTTAVATMIYAAWLDRRGYEIAEIMEKTAPQRVGLTLGVTAIPVAFIVGLVP